MPPYSGGRTLTDLKSSERACETTSSPCSVFSALIDGSSLIGPVCTHVTDELSGSEKMSPCVSRNNVGLTRTRAPTATPEDDRRYTA